MLAGLKHFRHRRHEVIVFHVLDPAELDFPFRQTTLFHGLEELPDVLTDPRALAAGVSGRVRQVLAGGAQGLPRAAHRLRAAAHRSIAGSRAVELSGVAHEPREVTAPCFRRPSLLAFGFGNLLMLGWLAAAAAPILIHLWNKRRYREVPWAAMEYLLAAHAEELAPHAARAMAAAGGPHADRSCWSCWPWPSRFWSRLGLNFVPGQRTLKVLVIDGSYSMGYKPTDKSRFERAKQLADADRRGKLAGRRLYAGADGFAAERDRRHAGRRAARLSGRDREPQAAARRRRSAGHAGPGRTDL